MADNSSKASELWLGKEAEALVKRCAEPVKLEDNVKGLIRRAGLRLGFTFARTQNLWYGEARRIDAGEMDRLREQAAKIEREVAVEHLVGLRRALAKTNTVKSSSTVAAIDNALRSLGEPICTLDLHSDGPNKPPRS